MATELIARRLDERVSVASDAVQLFGARGSSLAWPVERLLGDAKVLPVFEGSLLGT